jgi:hypothetical protein
MRVVTTREASQLTGLSTNKLREWTSRRALIPADVRPKSQGSLAKYSWQTILLLRIAVTLRERFHLELQAQLQVFASLRRGLHGTSFVPLWGKSLAIQADNLWSWVDDAGAASLPGDAIIIRLAPHLEVLSLGFALPRPSSSPGLPLAKDRFELNYFLKGLDCRDACEHQLANGLQLALEGDIEGAKRTIAEAKTLVLAKRGARGRFQYLYWSSGVAVILMLSLLLGRQ